MIGLLLACALGTPMPGTTTQEALAALLAESTPTSKAPPVQPTCKDKRLVLDSTGVAYSIVCGCTEDDLRELIGLASDLTPAPSYAQDVVFVPTVIVPPAEGLRRAAADMEAKDVKIQRLRELIVKCRRPEKK